jgi:hypothetical protein
MARSMEADKPFYVYLPYTQVHTPPIPDPEYADRPNEGSAGTELCIRALGHRKMPLAAKGALALTSVT